MRLEVREKFYNPFFVTVGGYTKEVEKIVAFDGDGKIVCETNCGWFGDGNNKMKDGIEFPCEIVRKLSVNLSCKTAFAVSKKEYGERDTKYTVYIPVSVLCLEEPTYRKEYGNIIVKEWKSSKYDGVVFSKRIRAYPEMDDVCDEVRELADSIKFFRSVDVMSHLEDLGDTVEKLEKAYKKLMKIRYDYGSLSAKELAEMFAQNDKERK